jgi:hypothetical protein
MAPYAITITVHRLRELFVDSIDDNPLISEWEADAGIQRVANALLTQPFIHTVRVTVRVPDTLDLTPARLARVRAAIERYCDARISENQRERRFKVQTGIIGFIYGFAFWIGMTMIVSRIMGQDGLPTWLTGTLDLIYVVSAWAILWEPLAAMFFTWLPNFLAVRVFRTIKRGEFVFEPVKMSEPDNEL